MRVDKARVSLTKVDGFCNEALATAGERWALHSQKDQPWPKTGPERLRAEEALNKEIKSLTTRNRRNPEPVLIPVLPDDPDYETAVKEAVSGRALLDVRRDGTSKAP